MKKRPKLFMTIRPLFPADQPHKGIRSPEKHWLAGAVLWRTRRQAEIEKKRFGGKHTVIIEIPEEA